MAIIDLYVSLIDTELAALHSEVENKLDNAIAGISFVFTIYDAIDTSEIPAMVDEYQRLARSGASQEVLEHLGKVILRRAAEEALDLTRDLGVGVVRHLGLLTQEDWKDWMIGEMAEDVALVRSSASQWIELWNTSKRQLFTYEQAQELAYHILLIRALGSSSSQALIDLKHNKPWWEFIGGRVLNAIPKVGEIVWIGSTAWDWIDRDRLQQPPTVYEPYNTWLIRARQSARVAVDQHDEFLSRLGLPLRDDYRLPFESR